MIKVISLFSGCGGLDLSFFKSNFNILWANDIDEKACETYRKNIGAHIVCANITTINPSDIPNADLILGGFPCQEFSFLGPRKGIDSKRGSLYHHFVSVVSEKNPIMFIAENVKGLLTVNKGSDIKQIVHDFSVAGSTGYNITTPLINFADYGVPQLRERVLIIGTRKDVKTRFIIPHPTHTLENYVSSKEALLGVETIKFNNERQKIYDTTKKKLELIPPGGNYTDIPKNSPHYVKGMISHVYRRLHPDKPSTTIIAAGGGGTWGYHYSEPRPLTNRERARLFGYPDDFIFAGSITDVRRQIGNSVPPTGMSLFAAAIKQFIIRHQV